MVGSPGVVKIPEGETLTVSKVIIMSGGFKDFANRKKVRLTRKSPIDGEAETKIVNVVDILHKGKLEEDIAVCDGDIIVVPEKFFNF
jgi:protein involved in polysaccharide export with SLBB domain